MNDKWCKIHVPFLLILIFMTGMAHPALARDVSVQSIQIIPTETVVGKRPTITGRISAQKVKARRKTLKIIVIAAVVRPDHVVKSWTWKKVIMRSGDVRSFTIPAEYDIKLPGTYKVDFNVYSRDMRPLHSLSRSFLAVDPSRLPEKIEKPEIKGSRTTEQPTESQHIGFGLYANTLNSSGGATMFLWPFKYVGLQGSYTAGSFTITEGRLLVRVPLFSGISSYLGAGYMKVTTERSVEIIAIKTRFQDTGPSGVIGAEIPLRRDLFGYIEVCGASIDLKKEVTNGSITGTASVKYAPVTVGIGLVYYLF